MSDQVEHKDSFVGRTMKYGEKVKIAAAGPCEFEVRWYGARGRMYVTTPDGLTVGSPEVIRSPVPDEPDTDAREG